MANITYFEKPEKYTIQEIIDASKAKKHYIVKTCYGDFDNVVEFAIVDLQVALQFTHYCATSIYGPKWSVVLQESHKYIIDFKKWENGISVDNGKKWDDVPLLTNCYSDSYYLEHIEDIYKQKIEVIGYIEE